MHKVRGREQFMVFAFFLSLGLIWMGLMPLWQGPDEPAQFAYVQYMEHHVFPPRQDIVPAGQSPWLYSPSSAENMAVTLSQRARVLQDPAAWFSWTPYETAKIFRAVAHASASPQAPTMGTQNYVEIYPPLYYDLIARGLRLLGLRNVFNAAYMARAVSALWLAVLGVVWNQVLSSVVRQSVLRLMFLATAVLAIPTVGMLGGVVNNDVVMDGASMAVFGASLAAMQNPLRFISWKGAVALGLLAGMVIWTKEEAYLALALSLPFVLSSVWRKQASWRVRGAWFGLAGATALLVAWPWFALMLHRYHALVPPLTYQSAGSNPRTWGFVVRHELLSRSFQMDMMVTQLFFGMDCPWWQPWISISWFRLVLGTIVIWILLGGVLAGRGQRGWALALVWISAGFTMLWLMQGEYNVLTGFYFLQGRYFLFLLAPASWLAAHWWMKWPKVLQIGTFIGAALLSLATMSRTIWRYYHHSLLSYLLGHVVLLAPPASINLSRICLGILATAVAVAPIALLAYFRADTEPTQKSHKGV
ncbi:hypothetical protein [Sulfobacillus sp. hq2]|uniref:hypothetical protein n=1 Tax=Sulfobacillus TaxID=28033 RepID=UPI000CD1DD4B|nr:hypothetical protein [Sulfobacillus sp. hq2]POB12049.1 hypothetical protein CO251_01110 [Sulfobacillus sp. hq2]